MTSVVCSADYAKKIVTMKSAGMAARITSLVIMDDKCEDLAESATAQGI